MQQLCILTLPLCRISVVELVRLSVWLHLVLVRWWVITSCLLTIWMQVAQQSPCVPRVATWVLLPLRLILLAYDSFCINVLVECITRRVIEPSNSAVALTLSGRLN